MPRFTYYTTGPRPEIGLTITKLFAHQFARHTRYRVRFHCCGEEVTITHETINAKYRKLNDYYARMGVKKEAVEQRGRPIAHPTFLCEKCSRLANARRASSARTQHFAYGKVPSPEWAPTPNALTLPTTWRPFEAPRGTYHEASRNRSKHQHLQGRAQRVFGAAGPDYRRALDGRRARAESPFKPERQEDLSVQSLSEVAEV